MPSLAEVPWFFSHIFPWGFILAGGSYTLDGLTAIIHALQSHRWPTVEGRVTRSSMDERDIGDSPATVHVPRVEYEYEVDGREFKGTRVTSSDSQGDSKEAALLFLKRFKVGDKVEVRYLPSAPGTALLVPGIRPRLIVNLVFAMLSLALGIAMLLFMPLIGKLPVGD